MKNRSLIPVIALALPLLGASNLAAADEGVGGSSFTFPDVALNTGNWFDLTTVQVTLMTRSFCTLTGSAEANNPLLGNSDNQYRFALKVDGITAANNSEYERTIEFDDNPVAEEVDQEEVSSTGLFEIEPGTHTFQWRARKFTVATDDMTVNDASLTFVCSERLLGNSHGVHIPSPD